MAIKGNVCGRLVRGFALGDREARERRTAWHARSRLPWAERERVDSLKRARQYDWQPVGRLLGEGA